MEILFTISLPLVGIIIGASLQYWFSKKNRKYGLSSELKTTAYSDFVNSVAEMKMSLGQPDEKIYHRAYQNLTSAKSRILIFGDTEVIIELAKWWEDDPILNSPDRITGFINVIQLMRKYSSLSSHLDLRKEINALLFGK